MLHGIQILRTRLVPADPRLARRAAAIWELSNRDQQARGSTRDSRRGGKDDESNRNCLSGLYRKRLQSIEDLAIRR